MNVQGTAPAEQDASSANVAFLTVPGVRPVTNAIATALTPDDRFLFVLLQKSGKLAVFNLHKTVTTGQNQPGVDVGTVAIGGQPTALAVSPDGQWLYVTSAAAAKATASLPSEGMLTVLSVPTLETHPKAAVVARVRAGCSPAGVAVSADGGTVWVTAQQSNAVLGFAAARLRAGSGHALTAEVAVGQTPTGAVLIDGGAKLIVADSDLAGVPGAANLAVVDTKAALARQNALVGYIASGRTPRSFALQPYSDNLFVADSGQPQLQVIDVGTVP